MKLKPAQRTAADQAWQAAAALLQAGAQAASLVLLDELQRAVHSCRVAGLHRLAAAGARAMQQVRELHAQGSGFRLGALSWDVFEFLRVAHALRTSSDEVDLGLIGEARRGYSDIGDLHLAGLFTEAVASATGYSGVVTYFADEVGALWSLGDIAPGDIGRCRFAYVAPFEVGQISVEHRALARSGIHLEHARAANNRRLGMGRQLVASLADGVVWTEPPLAGLFATPLSAQLERVWGDDRRAGDDLLCLHATIAGATSNAVLLRSEHLVLRAVAPGGDALAYRKNPELLSRAVGLRVWLIGRPVVSRPRTLQALALASPELLLPQDWHGRVNLALDHLLPEHLPPPRGSSVEEPRGEATIDPMLPLARRLEQVLLAGASAASPVAVSGFVRDEAMLQRNQLPTAAALLRRLRESSPDALPEAWLAARIYLAAAQGKLQREAWLG